MLNPLKPYSCKTLNLNLIKSVARNDTSRTRSSVTGQGSGLDGAWEDRNEGHRKAEALDQAYFMFRKFTQEQSLNKYHCLLTDVVSWLTIYIEFV